MIADCTQAIKIDPSFPYAYHGRGLAYKELKQYDKAIADFENAAELYT